MKGNINMLDKEDLQAIGGVLAQQKTDIMHDVSDMFKQQKAEMMHDVSDMFKQQKTEMMQESTVLMKSKFMPMFNLLAEGQQSIIDKLVPISRVDELEEEVKLLKIVVRQLSEDMHQLKHA